ncbi:hypothetical protein BASA60_000691 [Batrachochytrium salamandrivorans]|nr:hypothetical protein BASA60_000691 [Batrachochytrium salamandrivorans]
MPPATKSSTRTATATAAPGSAIKPRKPAHGSVMGQLGFPIYTPDVLGKINVKAVPVTQSVDPLVETAVYRSVLAPGELMSTMPNMSTMHEVFEVTRLKQPNQPALGTRHAHVHPITGVVSWGPYVFQTYAEVAKQRDHLAWGIQHIYTNVVHGSPFDKWHLGIFSINRAEWVITDLAAHAFSVAVVALYDTLGADTTEYILNHADVPIIVASIDKVPLLLSLSSKTKFKVIIALDSTPSVSAPGSATNPFLFAKTWASEKGISLYSYSEVLELGAKNPLAFRPPTESDRFCLCYTSGTTGNPKGAILSHGNMMAVLRASYMQFAINNTDVHISYLPLAHIFERCVLSTVIAGGGSIGFYRGDVALLIEDIGVLRPTLFASVPRLLNRIYDRITQQALHSGSAIKASMFQLSASAPINGEVLEFLRVVFSCHVLEAYGQTESTGLFTVSWPNDVSKGNVGPVAVK